MKLFTAVSVGAVLILAGCGNGEKVAEKIAEKALEKAIEKESGGTAEVDVDGGKVTVKTEEGEMEISSGGKAEIPDNFPKDIHIMDGAKVKGSLKVPQGHTLMLTTTLDPKAVMKTYKTKMVADGWDEKAAMDMGAQKMLTYTKNDRSATLLIARENNETVISITTGSSSLSSTR